MQQNSAPSKINIFQIFLGRWYVSWGMAGGQLVMGSKYPYNSGGCQNPGNYVGKQYLLKQFYEGNLNLHENHEFSSV